jgi:hypothetical protein
MAVLVDDVVLLRVLAGDPPAPARSTGIYTTGVWYFRLGQALRPGPPGGALSRRLAELPSDRRVRVLRLIDALPDTIGLIGLRTLVPVIRRLDPEAKLNLLAAEAVAAAYVTGATILVATDAPLLRQACDVADVAYEVQAE